MLMLIKLSDLKFLIIVLLSFVFACAGCGNSGQAKNPDKSAVVIESTEDDEFDADFDFMEEEFEENKIEVSDPLESFNRLMFGLNDTLYFWILKPVANGYVTVTPQPVRIGARNFFDNVTTPVRYVSCLAQGKGERADVELRRFCINTTEGLLGIADCAADKHGLQVPPEEDLGQALAVAGVGNGFYIVLPLLGPSTGRDALGRIGGIFLNPIYYIQPDEVAIGISVGKFGNEFSFHLGEYESFKADSIDPYVAMREIYIQYRDKQIQE